MKYPKFDVTLDLPSDDDKIKKELDFLPNMPLPRGLNCRLGVRLFPPAHPLATSEASELISKALHLVSYFVIPEATSGIEFCRMAGFIQDLAMQFDQGTVPLQAEITFAYALQDIEKIASTSGIKVLAAGLYFDEVTRVAKEHQLMAAVYGAATLPKFQLVMMMSFQESGYDRLVLTGLPTAEIVEALSLSCFETTK